MNLIINTILRTIHHKKCKGTETQHSDRFKVVCFERIELEDGPPAIHNSFIRS
jgi:hypothetical protein